MLNIFKKKRDDTQAAMDALLEGFQLQSFPALIMEVLNDLRAPDMSLGAVAQKLEGDPGVSVEILRLVNSAAFGLSREVTNLQSAIAMMGHARLESILLTHSVNGALPTVAAPGFSMQEFWKAAARRACTARAVAQRLHPTTQVEAFTAGLLLDMAVPVLVMRRTAEYAEILAAMANPACWLHELETGKFSFDHTDLGGHMARTWSLPTYLADVITDHHDPERSAALDPGVRVAALIRHDTGEASLAPVYELAAEAYGLDREIMDGILEAAFAEAEEFARRIS